MSDVLPVKLSEMKDSEETFFIELYIIELRTGIVRVAACDEDIEFAGETYIAVPAQRESIVRSMDNLTDSCNFSLSDCDEGHLAFVMNGFDFRGCSATIIRIQYPDSLSNPELVQWVFSGYIDSPAFAGGTFTCKLVSRFPEIEAPNRTYQLACNSDFGDECCGMSLCTTDVVIQNVNNNTITINTSYENDYWKNGVIKVLGETRIIESSAGNVLTLNVNLIQDNLIGKTAELTRGCNKTKEDCQRFNNLRHYGGFLAIPFENIYR